MDSDDCEVIYCPEDDEYRVYCNICDNLCIERFYKNHLISQTRSKSTHKRQQIIMQFKCDVFEQSRNIRIKSLKYEKCLRQKYITKNNPIFLKLIKY